MAKFTYPQVPSNRKEKTAQARASLRNAKTNAVLRASGRPTPRTQPSAGQLVGAGIISRNNNGRFQWQYKLRQRATDQTPECRSQSRRRARPRPTLLAKCAHRQKRPMEWTALAALRVFYLGQTVTSSLADNMRASVDDDGVLDTIQKNGIRSQLGWQMRDIAAKNVPTHPQMKGASAGPKVPAKLWRSRRAAPEGWLCEIRNGWRTGIQNPRPLQRR